MGNEAKHPTPIKCGKGKLLIFGLANGGAIDITFLT
jgi:hypothetical protein